MNVVVFKESVDRRCDLPLKLSMISSTGRLPFADQTLNVICVWHNHVADILQHGLFHRPMLGGVNNVLPRGKLEVWMAARCFSFVN